MKNLKILSIALVALFLAACKGKDGAPGATGPAGNANVTSTQVTVSSWTNSGTYYYYDVFNNADQHDVIMVYLKGIPTANDWTELPINSLITNGDQLTVSTFGAGTEIDYYNGTGAPAGSFTFNVVVIPPAVQKRHPNLNWNDYKQVKAVLHL